MILAALHIGKLKFLVDFLNMRLPSLSAFHALIKAKSPVMDSSRTYVAPLNSRAFEKSKQYLISFPIEILISKKKITSLVSLGTSIDLSLASYFTGWPPSWTNVFTPVGLWDKPKSDKIYIYLALWWKNVQLRIKCRYTSTASTYTFS